MTRYELLRYERGLTRQEAAAGAGISERTLRYVESEGGRPSAPTAKKLAEFYKVSVADLLGVPERKAA